VAASDDPASGHSREWLRTRQPPWVCCADDGQLCALLKGLALDPVSTQPGSRWESPHPFQAIQGIGAYVDMHPVGVFDSPPSGSLVAEGETHIRYVLAPHRLSLDASPRMVREAGAVEMGRILGNWRTNGVRALALVLGVLPWLSWAYVGRPCTPRSSFNVSPGWRLSLADSPLPPQ
jgi:hypothetical protein